MARRNPLAVSNTGRGKAAKLGQAGYDNPRENIDPHVRTRAVSTDEVICSEFRLLSGANVAGRVLTADAAGSGAWLVAAAGGDPNICAVVSGATLVNSGAILLVSGASLTRGRAWTSGSNIIYPSTKTHMISGAGLFTDGIVSGGAMSIRGDISGANITGANIEGSGWVSGSFIYGDGSNLDNIPGGGTDTTDWVTGATVIYPAWKPETISGANIHSSGVLSGATVISRGAMSGASINVAGKLSGAHVQVKTSLSGGAYIRGTGDVVKAAYSGAQRLMILDSQATPDTASNYPVGSIFMQYTP